MVSVGWSSIPALGTAEAVCGMESWNCNLLMQVLNRNAFRLKAALLPGMRAEAAEAFKLCVAQGKITECFLCSWKLHECLFLLILSSLHSQGKFKCKVIDERS